MEKILPQFAQAKIYAQKLQENLGIKVELVNEPIKVADLLL